MHSIRRIYANPNLIKTICSVRSVDVAACSALNIGVSDGKKAMWSTNKENIRNYSKIVVATITPPNVKNVFAVQIKNNALTRRFYSKSKSTKHHREYLSDSDSDSDSKHEHSKGKGKVKLTGESEFWRRKMRTLHGLLDVNNDGVISYDDFRLLADNFVALGHLKPEAEKEFREVLKTIWETQWGEITPYNLVNAEQYLTEMHHVVNDKSQRERIHEFLPYLFKAVDKDHSGFISIAEYKLFFKCLGLTPENAAVSFAVIDENSDGKLSIKEFVKLGREYFLTEDEKRISRMFWGPLANDH